MSSTSPSGERSDHRSTLDDPRKKPSSTSSAMQGTFLRRLARIRASQPVTRPGRISRASSIASNVLIPIILVYSVFLADWGPHEHVFSGPQRWLKRQKEAFWSLPSDGKAAPDSSSSRVGSLEN